MSRECRGVYSADDGLPSDALINASRSVVRIACSIAHCFRSTYKTVGRSRTGAGTKDSGLIGRVSMSI
jgi:hypothetical protein